MPALSEGNVSLRIEVIHGDAKSELAELEDNSIDSLLTDPPAGIAFMNKGWDKDKGGRDEWIAEMKGIFEECLRVMKPGAHGLVWALPRTSHWTATSLEDAGFEVRDIISHFFGSGFPKNMSISKAIEGTYGCRFIETASVADEKLELIPVESQGEKIGFVAVRVATPQEGAPESKTVIGAAADSSGQTDILLFESTENIGSNTISLLKSTLDDASKKASKCITLTKLKTIIDLKIWNLLQFQNTLGNTQGAGTALKPACEYWILVRKPLAEKTVAANVLKYGTGAINIDVSRIPTNGEVIAVVYEGDREGTVASGFGFRKREAAEQSKISSAERANAMGRWPAHLVFTEGEATEMLDAQYEGASRFFYVAKPSGKEKNAGLEDFEPQQVNDGRKTSIDNAYQRGDSLRKNIHPTVKPVKLMEYFCTLITPPGGVILDPFVGSGTTGVAAVNLGFGFVGIDMTEEYVDIAEARIREAYRGRKKKAA